MKKSKTEKRVEYIENIIKELDENGPYLYVGLDKDGLYKYTVIPKYDIERNVFLVSIGEYSCIIPINSSNEIDNEIIQLFEYGKMIKIEEAIKIIKGLIGEQDFNRTEKLFNLLSEVQGIEIKPYERFDIKDNYITHGPYYLDENFRRYYSNGTRDYNEDLLRGILTGEMKVLKCKKAVILTEDDIICLRYYLKNGYRYITNNVYFDGIMQYKIKGFKEEPKLTQNNIYWNYTGYNPYINVLEIEDGLSFIHYDYPEIWDIEELLEQERVSND